MTGKVVTALPVATPVRGGPRQGVVLIAVSWLAVIAAGVLAPVLPRMAQHFAGRPAVGLMIGFVATMPALAVTLLSVPAGHIVDRFGTRAVLLAGLTGFGLTGLLPIWLDSLPMIVASRFVTGICEAAVMTASTTLLGSCFQGRSRERWLTSQVASVNLMGVIVVFCGGLVGQYGWRAPFLAYGFGLLLLVPVAAVIRPPRTSDDDRSGECGAARLPWRALTANCAMTTLVSMSVYVVVIQFSLLLAERGIVRPEAIGPAIAIAASGMAVGALATAGLLNLRPLARLLGGLLLIAGGAAVAAARTEVAAMIAAMWIVGTGAGIAVPTLLAMTVGNAPPSARGKVTGAWTSALFFGQFLNPPIFVVLRALAGSQAAAIGWAALGYTLFAAVVGGSLALDRRRSA